MFQLNQEHFFQLSKTVPPFGFNGLGELVYRRTYSRTKANGNNEEWFETIIRVVNGTFNMQKEWMVSNEMGWDEEQAQRHASVMYDKMFHMKFLPPGRGLWAMGSPIILRKGLYAALNNCAFVSTRDIKLNPTKPFCFLMDMSMLGVGVGFDTHGEGSLVVLGIDPSQTEVFVVPDTREGWVEALSKQLTAYFTRGPVIKFDFSQVRSKGSPIRGFGGTSSGPEPLKDLLVAVGQTLEKEAGRPISLTAIVDLMNHIGCCVVSGNVRRTAEISFGSPFSDEYLNLKNYSKNPHRSAFGWASNNSVAADVGMDYAAVATRIRDNGEPGLCWLENMQQYSRMNGVIDNKDARAMGGNPCLEQTLESFELCCLVETFPSRHDSLEEYLETLKYAYMYAKTVTLGGTQWEESNRVMKRNRRIGCSVSGVAQFISTRGLNELKRWLEEGYVAIQQCDVAISEQFGIPLSIKTTSVKPSGTVSLLAGATPGVHFPESRFYVRRVRLSNESKLIPPLREAGYPIECAIQEPNTSVVEVPVDAGEGVRTQKEVCMWEQLSLAAFMQKHWADNQVSCTVTFDPKTEAAQLPTALDFFQYQLKGISFLPRHEYGAYPQMPYEAITEEQYNARKNALHPIRFRQQGDESIPDRFCDSDVCL